VGEGGRCSSVNICHVRFFDEMKNNCRPPAAKGKTVNFPRWATPAVGGWASSSLPTLKHPPRDRTRNSGPDPEGPAFSYSAPVLHTPCMGPTLTHSQSPVQHLIYACCALIAHHIQYICIRCYVDVTGKPAPCSAKGRNNNTDEEGNVVHASI